MCNKALAQEIDIYRQLGLILIPLKPRAKEPLVRWGDGWNPTREELGQWFANPRVNIGVRCGENLAVVDCDSEETFRNFTATHDLPPGCPVVKTGHGYHIWVKPKRPLRSQLASGVEIKCLGSYVVAPPSIHPNGTHYIFVIPPNTALPEVDLARVVGLGRIDSLPCATTYESIRRAAPSEFALRYGKSLYLESVCGLATKVSTSEDGNVKKLVSLRCWRWHCPKCAPLLKLYWQNKLEEMLFRFILRLPTVDKPNKFLRCLGKPRYVHIVANGESWLLLMDGGMDEVWVEAQKHRYVLVAGDASGDPTPEDVMACLEEALDREERPLNTRRKITHSKSLLTAELLEI